MKLLLPILLLAATAEPRVAVIGPGLDDGVRTGLTESLKKHRVDVVDDHPAVIAANAAATNTVATNLERASAQLREGQERYKKFKPREAEKLLRNAAALYEDNIGDLRDLQPLIEVYVTLGEIFFATDRTVQGREVFRRVVQLNPDIVLDVTSHPPSMVRAFKDVKQQVLDTPLGTLRVESTPAGARVFLDGRERGATPITIQNIPTGVHAVSLQKTGYAPLSTSTDVTSFREGVVRVPMVVASHPGVAELLDGSETTAVLQEYLGALAAAADLDVVVVASGHPQNGGLAVRGYQPDRTALSPVHRLTEYDGAADRVLKDAEQLEWIPPLAARRRLAYGGGALDETARMRVQATLASGLIATSQPTSFPEGWSPAVRVGVLRRLRPRLVAILETGLDLARQNNIQFFDDAGNVVIGDENGIDVVYWTVPLELGIRYYFGIRRFAWFVAGGGDVRLDLLQFPENLRFDDFKASPGVGAGIYVSGGTDVALNTRSGLTFELRWNFSLSGVTEVKHDDGVANRVIPITPDVISRIRLLGGYLIVF